MRTNGRIGSDGRGFARIGAIDRPLPVVTPSGSRGAVGQGGVIDSHVVPHPRVNPGHCSGLLHLHPMVAPHTLPAPDPHHGLCITIPPAAGGTGFRDTPRSVRRSEAPIPARTAHKGSNYATPERTQRWNQALVCGRGLRKHRPCVRNWGRGAHPAPEDRRRAGTGSPAGAHPAPEDRRRAGTGSWAGEGATGVGGPRPGLRVCGVERGGEGVLRRRTGGPENWRTGGPEDRRVRARALQQRNAPELPWRPSSARRR